MRFTALLLSFTSVAAVAGCATTQVEPSCPDPSTLEAGFPGGEMQIASHADAIAWAPCPPTLPTPCEMAVLEGDPKRPMLFTVRFRVDGKLEMKPHSHPQNERVTILEGRVGVGFGDEIDLDNITWFGPGDYYVNAKQANHFVLTDGPAVLQITGIGPWRANFLEAE